MVLSMTTKGRSRRAGAIGLGVLLVSASFAWGFGTVNTIGQSAEHERITRRAFTCASLPSNNSCFEPKTLDLLAGKDKMFGAIGYPDGSTNFFEPNAHCDNGDLPGQLAACRTWMKKYFDEAVKDANALVDANGGVIGKEVGLGCVWAFNVKGKAKCNVLQDMGFVLHAAQDFYSHSNWSDNPIDSGVIGLGNTTPSTYIGLRQFDPFPAELVSGCYIFGKACPAGRITHDALNKDLGSIPLTGPIGPGATERGKKNNDFERAVTVAIADTGDKWALLREVLVRTYGPQRGTQMICALAHDDPGKAC